MTTYIHTLNPQIAAIIGESESILLNQLEYWISKCGRTVDNLDGKWVYNSYKEWSKQFIYWSVSKLRRTIKSLETLGLIRSAKLNSKKWNQTKWYSIVCDQYDKLLDSSKKKPLTSKTAKIRKKVLISILDSSNNAMSMKVRNTPHNLTSLAVSKTSLKSNKIIPRSHKNCICSKLTNQIVQKEQLILNETKNNYTKKYSYKEEKSLLKNNQTTTIGNIQKQKNIAKQMVVVWNGVFEFSLKPIQAFSNNKTAQQLVNVLGTRFNNDLSEWKKYAKKINSSKFLMGEKETKNNFKAEFTWLIKEEVIDSIQSGAYGAGDRTLDSEKLEENLKVCEKDIKQEFKTKVAKYLEEKVPVAAEEQEFKHYLMSREYENDGDKYEVKKHMESIGKNYVYGDYITPSHVFYPGNEKYRKRLFNSFLMKKYCGVDETLLDSEINVSITSDVDRGILFKSMQAIKNKISNFDGFFDSKNYKPLDLLGFRQCFKGGKSSILVDNS